jgi:hypothetical protein
MKFLCLAFGDGKDWNALTPAEQDKLAEQDQIIRDRGALMAAVETTVTTVRAWNGQPPTVTPGPSAQLSAPLAGFSVIEAANLEEVIQLVAKTPCAYAKGAIEIRPILAINN